MPELDLTQVEQMNELGSKELNDFWPVRRNWTQGWGRRGRQRPNPAQQAHEARVAEALEFFVDVRDGLTPYWTLLEAMRPSDVATQQIIRSNYPGLFSEGQSVSDFPHLTGDILDRMLLARFSATPQTWRQYIPVRGRPLRDFRSVKNIKTDGGNAYWDKLTEKDGLQYTALTEAPYTYSPALYGKASRLSFEMLMNDDLGAFDEIPRVLGLGGAATLHRFATGLLWDASGPNALIFNAPNGNLLASNPPLDIASLGVALSQLMGRQDSEGQPISILGLRLVYGTGLHVTANNLMNQLSVDVSGTVGGTTDQVIRVNNWLIQGLTPVLDRFVDVVASTANAATSWMLVQDPAQGRPIAEVGFLNGFQEPGLFRKASNTATMGGGIQQNLGDWQSMGQEFKGVQGYGGTQMEPLVGVASNGSGS